MGPQRATAQPVLRKSLVRGLCCLLLVSTVQLQDAAGAVTTDWGSGIRSELAVGYAPRGYGVNVRSEPIVALELLPAAGSRLSTPSSSLTTRFEQRLYLRQPNMLNYDRPLVFNRIMMAYQRTLTSRLTVNASGTAAGGAMDFMAAPTLLRQPSIRSDAASSGNPASPSQPSTVPRAPILQLVTLNAGLGTAYQLTPRQNLGLSLTAAKSSPLASDTSGLRRTQQLSASLAHEYAWSSRTDIQSTVTASDILGGFGTRYRTGSVNLGITHDWSPLSTFGVSAGVSAFSPNNGSIRWFPAMAANTTHTRGAEGRRLVLSGSLNLIGFFDPILGVIRSSVGIGAGATQDLGRRWTFLARTDLIGPASTQPLSLRTRSQYRAVETIANATVGLSHPIGNQAQFDTGMRFTLMATHPRDFQVISRQAWLYAAVSIWNGTDRQARGAWVR